MGCLSTGHCNREHTSTIDLPRKDTGMGPLSTVAGLLLTYPEKTTDLSAPEDLSSGEGLSQGRKGDGQGI